MLAAGLCAILLCAGLFARPVFPVDETRYLTVAWEMKQSGNFIVPSLNYEVYHHKPPVLFWLINVVWSIAGVSLYAAMIVPYLVSFALLLLTARLAHRLFPKEPHAGLIAIAFLGGSLPFVIYANLIMFDLLLSVFVVLGITAIWDFVKDSRQSHLLILGVAIGAGILTKGPVMLLHLAFVLLGARFWYCTRENCDRNLSTRHLIKPIVFAILFGALIALSWAIPAAILGGKEFADKIFWGQTAGRMVNAFDHQRPIYWYLMFIPVFVLPWALSATLWKGVKNFVTSCTPEDTEIKRFLSIWIIPLFIAFSLISGKQIHYLVPLMPAIALFFTAGFLRLKTGSQMDVTSGAKQLNIWPILVVVIILSLVPLAMNLTHDWIGSKVDGSVHIEETFSKSNPLIPVFIVSLILIAGMVASRSAIRSDIGSIMTVAVSMVIMMAGFMVAAKNGFLLNYDLSPMAKEIEKLDESNLGVRPLAFARTYHGEFGFMARLSRPVEQIAEADIPSWLAEHPQGLVFYRTKNLKDYSAYHILYQQPYALSGYYAIIEQAVHPH